MPTSAKLFVTILSAMAALVLAPAAGAVSVLDFEGVQPTFPFGAGYEVRDYYNGGTSSLGTSGSDYGVSFGYGAIVLCLNTSTTLCSGASRGGYGNPASEKSGLVFADWNISSFEDINPYVNVANGFDTGFSLYYAAFFRPGSITIWDGLNGTGNLLGTITLGMTPSECDPVYGNQRFCPFYTAGTTFAGVAKSLDFNNATEAFTFDDLTFGSANPGPNPPLPSSSVPEPAAWMTMLLGFGLVGGALRRRSSPRPTLRLPSTLF